MKEILIEILENYLAEKETAFKENSLANKIRNNYPKSIEGIILDRERYKIDGSPGKGRWSEVPWIAIFDRLVTDSAQSGYYPVFLFKADMSGVYLSLNQGVTDIKETYKRDAAKVLRIKSLDFRNKLNYDSTYIDEINLEASTINAKLYESGNILAKYFSLESLQSNMYNIENEILLFLQLYNELTYNDLQISDDIKDDLTAIEKKQLRLHFRIERNSSISEKVKKNKGYQCEACNFNFEEKYGTLGEKFIEAHHLKAISTLNMGETLLNIESDFAVLCSNCHRMIHRLENTSDLQKLKSILVN
ncbi:DUF3578 domain-containing protein [Chryseobacterium sp. Alg-005]|uniref:MrcB family domain-containing protein n=1 Tax=Chryseobacterium sp. Alg-005 TaxID=3159516 RepID=UPI003555BB78